MHAKNNQNTEPRSRFVRDWSANFTSLSDQPTKGATAELAAKAADMLLSQVAVMWSLSLPFAKVLTPKTQLVAKLTATLCGQQVGHVPLKRSERMPEYFKGLFDRKRQGGPV